MQEKKIFSSIVKIHFLPYQKLDLPLLLQLKAFLPCQSLLLLFNCNILFHARKSTSLQLQPFLPYQKVYFFSSTATFSSMPENLLLLTNCKLFFHVRKSTSSLGNQRLIDITHPWVNWQRNPRSHELFISNFKTFWLVPTNCFTANQIACRYSFKGKDFLAN